MVSMLSAAGVTMTKSRAFWAASEAAATRYRERVTQFPGRQVQGRSDEFVRKEARWRASASRYLRAYGSLANRFDGVRVDPKLQDIVLQLMEGIAPRLQAAYDQHFAALAFAAWREWPVASGLSQSLLQLEYAVSEGGDSFTGRFRSAAPYTVFIAGQPHRRLIDRPAAEVADRIATDAIDEIARMGGG